MALMSPFRYRLFLLKQALSWRDGIIYEVLIHHKENLPAQGLQVSWERDGDFIVGSIVVDGETYMTQAKTAKEFVEMVNDTLYAVYKVPPIYAAQLGGDYRLTPKPVEFEKLNNAAIKKSRMDFDAVLAVA